MLLKYQDVDYVFIPRYEIKVDFISYYGSLIKTEIINLHQEDEKGLITFLENFEDWKTDISKGVLTYTSTAHELITLAKPFDFHRSPVTYAKASIASIHYFKKEDKTLKVTYEPSGIV